MSAPSPTLLAPMRIERRALRRGATGIAVGRTGMGLRRAAATAAALGADRPVVLAGVAGGLRDRLAPGTLVVADRILDASGTTRRELAAAPMLARSLERAGLRVAVGPVISVGRMVTSDHGRATLARLGALAVDTESAALAGHPGPLAVVRAVADTPGHRLVSPATIPRGRAALRALTGAAPVLAGWLDATGPRAVLLAGPRSSCAGVERAVATVEAAIERLGPPVYVRRPIVHNERVVAGLTARGAVFVAEVDEVPVGATVVFSAHGVAPAVRAAAEQRSLRVVDATCPLVAKVHREVRRFASAGRQVVLVGHAGHDEVTGTLGEVPGMRLVEGPDDVGLLDLDAADRVAYVTQTTLAPDDVSATVAALEARFDDLVGPAADDICFATHNRQEAVAAVAGEADLTVVVGSATSSNAHRLVEVAGRAGGRALLVADAAALDPADVVGARTLAVTAAASTPESVVTELLATLADLGPLEVHRRDVRTESVSFPLPLEVR